MSKKRQHFVPQVYLRAWETTVTDSKNQTIKFKGVYVCENENLIEGKTCDKILWKPNYYTVNYERSNVICKSCLEVKKDFVDKIYNILRNGQKPVYALMDKQVIKTRSDIDNFFFDLDKCRYYYDNGDKASDEKIIKNINSLNSYVIEDAFDKFIETRWQKDLKDFIVSIEKVNMHDLDLTLIQRILDFAIVMMCRNPKFNGLGTYPKAKAISMSKLESIYELEYKQEINSEDKKEIEEFLDENIENIWYSDLYKIFHEENGGFYHFFVKTILDKCQIILYRAPSKNNGFITSDNPSFIHISHDKNSDKNGLIFPLSPEFLFFIGKGNINVVNCCHADSNTVAIFNGIIADNKANVTISNNKPSLLSRH